MTRVEDLCDQAEKIAIYHERDCHGGKKCWTARLGVIVAVANTVGAEALANTICKIIRDDLGPCCPMVDFVVLDPGEKKT